MCMICDCVVDSGSKMSFSIDSLLATDLRLPSNTRTVDNSLPPERWINSSDINNNACDQSSNLVCSPCTITDARSVFNHPTLYLPANPSLSLYNIRAIQNLNVNPLSFAPPCNYQPYCPCPPSCQGKREY